MLLAQQPAQPGAETGRLPPARGFHDSRYGVSFSLPAGWNSTRTDGELSTFALDVRSLRPRAQLREVAQLAFNPYPASTFAGAFFYFSVVPSANAASCAGQAVSQAPRSTGQRGIGGVTFAHGYDQHGRICTESRDEIYTALRGKSCLRFDLVLNTFCGGEVSGAQTITDAQIAAVRARMEAILDTVRFDGR